MQIDLNEKSNQIPANECAIFSTDNMTELRMTLPEYVNGDSEWPTALRFLLAVFMRTRDPDFITEQLVWFDRFVEAEIENKLFGTQ
jgi:hypothetical protein